MQRRGPTSAGVVLLGAALPAINKPSLREGVRGREPVGLKNAAARLQQTEFTDAQSIQKACLHMVMDDEISSGIRKSLQNSMLLSSSDSDSDNLRETQRTESLPATQFGETNRISDRFCVVLKYCRGLDLSPWTDRCASYIQYS